MQIAAWAIERLAFALPGAEVIGLLEREFAHDERQFFLAWKRDRPEGTVEYGTHKVSVGLDPRSANGFGLTQVLSGNYMLPSPEAAFQDMRRRAGLDVSHV